MDENQEVSPEELQKFKLNLATMSTAADQLRGEAFELLHRNEGEKANKIMDRVKRLRGQPEDSLDYAVGLLADIGFCAIFLNRYENSAEIE